MPKRHAPSDADKWDLYNFIDVGFDPFTALVWSNYFKFQYTVAIVLVVVAMGSAEPPARGGVFSRQQSFQPRGVRPAPPLRFVVLLELGEQLVNVCLKVPKAASTSSTSSLVWSATSSLRTTSWTNHHRNSNHHYRNCGSYYYRTSGKIFFDHIKTINLIFYRLKASEYPRPAKNSKTTQ